MGQSPSSSKPTVKHRRLMDFPLAMQAIIDGKTITKQEWGNDDVCQLREGWLMIQRDGKWHTWLVNDGDLAGKDWKVVA
jgi:hypothetical protein